MKEGRKEGTKEGRKEGTNEEREEESKQRIEASKQERKEGREGCCHLYLICHNLREKKEKPLRCCHQILNENNKVLRSRILKFSERLSLPVKVCLSINTFAVTQ